MAKKKAQVVFRSCDAETEDRSLVYLLLFVDKVLGYLYCHHPSCPIAKSCRNVGISQNARLLEHEPTCNHCPQEPEI